MEEGVALYLLNSPVLSDFGMWSYQGPLTTDEARALVEDGFHSAIGHQATATLLSRLLGRPVGVNRTSVILENGDKALIFQLERRLPEGRVLSEAELLQSGYRLGLLQRLS